MYICVCISVFIHMMEVSVRMTKGVDAMSECRLVLCHGGVSYVHVTPYANWEARQILIYIWMVTLFLLLCSFVCHCVDIIFFRECHYRNDSQVLLNFYFESLKYNGNYISGRYHFVFATIQVHKITTSCTNLLSKIYFCIEYCRHSETQ